MSMHTVLRMHEKNTFKHLSQRVSYEEYGYMLEYKMLLICISTLVLQPSQQMY